MASSTIIFALAISLVAAQQDPTTLQLLEHHIQTQEMHHPYRIVGGGQEKAHLAEKLEQAQIPRAVVQWYLENSEDKTSEVRMTDLEEMATQMEQKSDNTVKKGGKALSKFLADNDAKPLATAFRQMTAHSDEKKEDPAVATKEDDITAAEGLPRTSGVKGVSDIDSEKSTHLDEPKDQDAAKSSQSTEPAVADESVAAAAPANESTSATATADTGGWDIVFWCLLTAVVLVAGWWAYKMKLHDRLATAVAEATFAVKKWFSAVLKGGKSNDAAQADGQSSTSESSLGSKSGATSQSSGMGGLNTHLQGVIDRVKKNFQEDGPDQKYGKLEESDAAAAGESSQGAPKPKPKTGYQRGSKA